MDDPANPVRLAASVRGREQLGRALGLLDRQDDLQRSELPTEVFHSVPVQRATRPHRQGEHNSADGLRDLPDNRPHAIIAVCVVG